jgi:hypothetical protein
MTNDIYFEVFWLNDNREKQGGLAVQIPHTDKPPGDLIKVLTNEVRAMRESRGFRLKTQIHTALPADAHVRCVDEYLWAGGACNTGRFARHVESLIQTNHIHRFIPRTGVVATGFDLVGRDNKIKELRGILENKRSCHLRAPRRYGKTSILLSIKELIENVVFIEVSDVGSLAGFLKALLKGVVTDKNSYSALLQNQVFKLWPSIEALQDTALFNNLFKKLTDSSPSIERLINEMLTIIADNGTGLLVDEFSIFLREMHENSVDELNRFLEIFKTLRGRKESPLSVALAGSAGLSTYIEFYNLAPYFNDLCPVDLPPVEEEDARILIEELFYGMDKTPSPAVIDSIMEHTGQGDPIPYFIQALVNETITESGGRKEITGEQVAGAYYDRLLGPAGNFYFRDFLLRERTYPKPCKQCASNVLKTLARRFPEPAPESDLKKYFTTDDCIYEKLMSCLEEDYDLVRSDQGCRLRSKVLADRWRLGEPWLTREDAS